MARDIPRILLFNPPPFRGFDVVRLMRSEYVFLKNHAVPPMDLAYFYAAARRKAEQLIVDANGERLEPSAALNRMLAFRPDIVVVKGVLNILQHDLEIAGQLKQKNNRIQIILSCRGCLEDEQSIFREFPFLDGIARGEIDAFALDLCAGTPLSQIAGMAVPDHTPDLIRIVEDLNQVPIPDLDALPPLWHQRYSVPHWGCKSGYFISTARGCNYHCTFCLSGLRPFTYRRRDVSNVIEELRWVKKRFEISNVLVFDEIFTVPSHAEAVCESILAMEYPFSFVCEGKPDLVSAPLLHLMKRAGFFCIHYGVESGDTGILRNSKKGHTQDDCLRAVGLTQAAQILASVYIILGFPQETWQSFLRTVRLLRKMKPDFIRLDNLLLYAATEMHQKNLPFGLPTLSRKAQDRRVSPLFRRNKHIRNHKMPAWQLAVADRLFRMLFFREIYRNPAPPETNLDQDHSTV